MARPHGSKNAPQRKQHTDHGGHTTLHHGFFPLHRPETFVSVNREISTRLVANHAGEGPGAWLHWQALAEVMPSRVQPPRTYGVPSSKRSRRGKEGSMRGGTGWGFALY